MAVDTLNDVVNKGSGRAKLPSRLRSANFGATVLAALQALAADTVLALVGPLRLKNYTTTQRNTLASGWGAGDKGKIVYDSTLDCVVMWDGSAWKTPDGGVPA